MPRLAGLTPTNDLAPGIITRGQDTGVLMPEHDAAPDIILIVGQSNAAGNGHPIRSTAAPADHLVQWWHTGTDPYKATATPVVEPTAYPYDGSTGTSPGVVFARHWAAWYRRRTIVVPAAWGGTGLISGGAPWQESGSQYRAAVQEVKDCADATGGRLAAIVWCQGEQDSVAGVSNSPTDGYGVVAARVLQQMRTDLGNKDAVIAVGGMVPDWVGLGQGTAQAIQGALAALPSTLTRCVYAVGGAGTGTETDGIHYSSAGTRQVGDGLWQAYRRLIDPTLPPARPPAPGLSATATGCKAWLVSSPGATSYEVRYRAGGGWQTATTSGMIATITTSMDVLVEAQVRGVGATGTGPWSASTVCAPVLSGTSLLVDTTGKGTPHRQLVASLDLGAGRTASQATVTSQPRMDREDGIADGPAIRFDGRDDHLDGPSVAATALGAASGTFSVVAVMQADAPHDGSVFGWRSDTASIFNLGVQADGQVIAQGFDDAGSPATATAVVDVTRPHVVIADRWGQGVSLTIDGVSAGAGASGPSRTTGQALLTIGAAYRGTASAVPLQFFRGRLGWLAVFPNVLTIPQKTAVTSYLRARFNI